MTTFRTWTLIVVFLEVFSALFIWWTGRDHLILWNVQEFHSDIESTQTALPTDWSQWELGEKQSDFAPTQRQICESDFWQHAEKGYSIHPRNQVGTESCRLLKTGETLTQAKYSFDSLGRRQSPPCPDCKKHMAFAGCSFTFGQGLENHQTLPVHYRNLATEVRTLNLARIGGSVSDLIYMLTHEKKLKDVKSPGRLLVFFYGEMHLPRFIGTARTVGLWNQYGADVHSKDSDKTFSFQGGFTESRPLFTILSRIIMKSHFVRLTGFDWPNAWSDQSFLKYAQALKYTEKLYKEHHIDNQLIVVIPPLDRTSPGLISHLENLKLPYLDYSQFPIKRVTQEPLFMDHDGHPTEKYNRVLAQQLARDLEGL